MKQITVTFNDGGVITLIGDVMLDAAEDSLIVYGEDGSYVNCNWSHVALYVVTKYEPDEDDDDE